MDLEANDPQNFEKLLESINSAVGFNCSHYTESFLKRRIEVRLRHLSIKSYLDYSKVIEKDKEEGKKLKKELTIHTTNFYRDKRFYDYFRSDIINFLKEKCTNKEIKIWSAGSSTGEEAVTIAVCLAEELGEDFKDYKIKIKGTDYSRSTVEKAKEAIYDDYQFREMPDFLKKKHFDEVIRDGKKSYQPKSYIRNVTEYVHGDIITSGIPNGMDIIFCRNTVIYFGIPVKERFYEDVYRALPDDRLFIMGLTEMLIGPAREMFQIFDSSNRVYIKR